MEAGRNKAGRARDRFCLPDLLEERVEGRDPRVQVHLLREQRAARRGRRRDLREARGLPERRLLREARRRAPVDLG